MYSMTWKERYEESTEMVGQSNDSLRWPRPTGLSTKSFHRIEGGTVTDHYDENSKISQGALDRLMLLDVWVAAKDGERGAHRVPVAKVLNSFIGIDAVKMFAGYEVELKDGDRVNLYSDNTVKDDFDRLLGTWSKGDSQ